MRGSKLRSGVNWQGVLKQKDVKQTDIKKLLVYICVNHGITQELKNTKIISILLKNNLNSISPHNRPYWMLFASAMCTSFTYDSKMDNKIISKQNKIPNS
jgi:hypothetical protein